MARGFNSVQLIGTITQEPTLRYTAGGLAILDLNLAGSERVTGDDGQVRNSSWYHRVSFFAKPAEILADMTQVGSVMFVDARLNFRSWEQDGQKRSSLDLKGIRGDVMSVGMREEDDILTDKRGQPILTNALNSVTLIGNLTQDVELKETQSGIPLAKLNVAVNENYRDKNGNDQESVHYVTVQLWRDMAQGCADLTKGAPVLVQGRFVTNSWESDGQKRYQNIIEPTRVEFLARGGEQPANATPQPVASAAKARVSAMQPIDADEFLPEDDLPF